jgi:hypothetical protein
MLEDFSKDLQEHGLADISAAAQIETPSHECFQFSILAGLAEGKGGEDLDITSERAISKQRSIAQFACEMRR